jgi:hypothetical protein
VGASNHDFFSVLILNRFEMVPAGRKHSLVGWCAEFPNEEITVNGFKKDLLAREQGPTKRSHHDEDLHGIGDIGIEEMA